MKFGDSGILITPLTGIIPSAGINIDSSVNAREIDIAPRIMSCIIKQDLGLEAFKRQTE